MKGFFSKKETESKSRPDGKSYSCASCGLYKHKYTPRMEASGNFKKGILNIGEAPDEIEDRKGKQWQGRTGRALRQQYKKLGIDLFEDCLNINSVNCRPVDEKGNNRQPTDHEIACCRRCVLKLIEQYKPKAIVLLGGAAVKSIIGHRWKKDLGGISKWRGWTIPDRDFNAWICPVFHPSYIEEQEVTETIWEQDLERALSKINDPLPEFPNDENNIEYIWDQGKLENVLEEISMGNQSKLTFFDYETTGLKPHAKGHKIVCCAIATRPDHAYAFMMPRKRVEGAAFRTYLKSPKVNKAAANMKFEDMWSNVRLKTPVNKWVFDTMQAAHILDNRPEITSLKFQSYVQLGVIDYDSEVSPYLKGRDEKNANSMNRIYEFIDKYGEKDLLTYCGLDALYEYQLGVTQMKKMGFDALLELAEEAGVPDWI